MHIRFWANLKHLFVSLPSLAIICLACLLYFALLSYLARLAGSRVEFEFLVFNSLTLPWLELTWLAWLGRLACWVACFAWTANLICLACLISLVARLARTLALDLEIEQQIFLAKRQFLVLKMKVGHDFQRTLLQTVILKFGKFSMIFRKWSWIWWFWILGSWVWFFKNTRT